MNFKTTKRALFMSIISLFLCFTMLLGTTFAWFTDSVTSMNNIIVSGNLDVELYHTNKNDTNEKVTSKTVLFDDIALWEPGAVAYENFKITNEGNLALKYRLSLLDVEATEYNGNKLTDVIKVGLIEGGFAPSDAAVDDRTEAINKITTWIDIDEFSKNGTLAANDDINTQGVTEDEAVYGIVLYWLPTDSDNDYNMNNGNTTVLKIDFGVSLFATQLESEADSFGTDYDAGACLHDEDKLAFKDSGDGATHNLVCHENLGGCGEIIETGIAHVFDGYATFEDDKATHHYSVCQCGAKGTKSEHSYDENGDCVCGMKVAIVLTDGTKLNWEQAKIKYGVTDTAIGNFAFKEAGDIITVDIPEGVKMIGSYAFCGCTNLISVTIPSTVTAIGSYAFSGCVSLTYISYLGTSEPTYGSAFNGCSSANGVYVTEDYAGDTFCGLSVIKKA